MSHQLTSLTLRPSVSNFLPYCFLDFVELLVMKTNLLPWRKREINISDSLKYFIFFQDI